MANVPMSLCDSSLALFHLAISISSSDPWPLSPQQPLNLVLLCCSLMKSGDRLFHLPSLSRDNGASRKYQQSDVTPKGCMVVRVGEERQRSVVPVVYPLFARLLKEAAEEYGFEQEGAIIIPCRVDYFRQVTGMIDRESLL